MTTFDSNPASVPDGEGSDVRSGTTGSDDHVAPPAGEGSDVRSGTTGSDGRVAPYAGVDLVEQSETSPTSRRTAPPVRLPTAKVISRPSPPLAEAIEDSRRQLAPSPTNGNSSRTAARALPVGDLASSATIEYVSAEPTLNEHDAQGIEWVSKDGHGGSTHSREPVAEQPASVAPAVIPARPNNSPIDAIALPSGTQLHVAGNESSKETTATLNAAYPAKLASPTDSTELPVAEVVDDIPATRRRSLPVRIFLWIGSVLEWCFGAVTLTFGLAVLATLPVIQFLSLGYLLEASGRVARSGRIFDGFVGVRKAARVGSIVVGTFLVLLPLRFVSGMWYSAQLIDPTSEVTAAWRIGLLVSSILTVGHILWAWYRGGRFRDFLWPAPIRLVKTLFRGGMYRTARDAVWNFVVELRLPYYFWMGARGFAGAVAWLFVPVLLFIGASTLEAGPAVISGLLGALSLSFVLLHLPFLQAHFAAENRLVCFFELGRARRMFRRAPLAFWFALLITLLFALPLYLLKIEMTPREVAFLPSLVFVTFIFPARLLTGWAVAWGERKRTHKAWFGWRWGARLAAIPVVLIYVLIVFFSRYTSWYGVWSTFEQHAFLVPVPFLGL